MSANKKKVEEKRKKKKKTNNFRYLFCFQLLVCEIDYWVHWNFRLKKWLSRKMCADFLAQKKSNMHFYACVWFFRQHYFVRKSIWNSDDTHQQSEWATFHIHRNQLHDAKTRLSNRKIVKIICVFVLLFKIQNKCVFLLFWNSFQDVTQRHFIRTGTAMVDIYELLNWKCRHIYKKKKKKQKI